MNRVDGHVTPARIAPSCCDSAQFKSIPLAPRIAAQVLERRARLGDSIEKGQALVVLSSVEMAQAQGDFLVAERELQRVRKLGREVVSEQRYTEARIKREQARARVSARRDRCRGADGYLPSAPTY